MKTAVELLVSKLFDPEVPLDEHIYNDIEQAKEMEKEYIKKGWLQDRDITFGDWQQEFEQWYNETFKQQEQ
jgi:ribosomal protein S24E